MSGVGPQAEKDTSPVASRGRLAFATGFVRDDAVLWNVTPRFAVATGLVPVVVSVTMFLVAAAPSTFFWLSDEDHPVEWAQFVLLVLATVGFALATVKLWRLGYRATAVAAALLTLGLTFIAGEEISWGQRILGFETPSELQGANYQNEATLHNIGGLHAFFVDGVALIGLYGAAAPFLWHALRLGRAPTWMSRLLVPPLFLFPAFVLPFIYRAVRFVFAPEEHYHAHIGQIVEYSETTELCLYFGVCVFAILYLRTLRAAAPHRPAP